MGSRQSFHVTGESCRANGNGEPAGQYLPTPGPFVCVLLELTAPGFEHASRIAAAPGSAREATADRLSSSLLVIPSRGSGRSFGCLAIAAHTLSPSLDGSRSHPL